MARIDVETVGDNTFDVRVADGESETTHRVTVGHDNAQLGNAAAEDLVVASFQFLLDREPKESILPEFDLAVIPRYFPEYESKIGDYLG